MSEINDGGPAFPGDSMKQFPTQEGMSLRDWFAGKIAAGLAASDDHRRWREGCGMTFEQWRAKCDIDIAICRMDFGGWSICVCADRTSIGCQTHPNESWLAWEPDNAEIVRMHGDAPAWWATHGEAVKAVIRCVMAKAKKGGEA